MRLLLDECVPRRFKHALSGHVVATVPEMGWAGMKNGALLQVAAESFDVFVTVDQNVRYQQTLGGSSLIVVILRVPNARLESLLPLAPGLLAAVDQATPGSVIAVGTL